jgi:hypothetical protein
LLGASVKPTMRFCNLLVHGDGAIVVRCDEDRGGILDVVREDDGSTRMNIAVCSTGTYRYTSLSAGGRRYRTSTKKTSDATRTAYERYWHIYAL